LKRKTIETSAGGEDPTLTGLKERKKTTVVPSGSQRKGKKPATHQKQKASSPKDRKEEGNQNAKKTVPLRKEKDRSGLGRGKSSLARPDENVQNSTA